MEARHCAKSAPLVSHFRGDRVSKSATRISSSIGERLRAYREAIGLSQDRLADLVGGTKRGIQDNESGKTAPNSKLLTGLVRNGLNANWLLTGTGAMLLEQHDTSNQGERGAIDGQRLELTLRVLVKASAAHRDFVASDKLGKLAMLVYRFSADKSESEVITYVEQLVELMTPPSS